MIGQIMKTAVFLWMSTVLLAQSVSNRTVGSACICFQRCNGRGNLRLHFQLALIIQNNILNSLLIRIIVLRLIGVQRFVLGRHGQEACFLGYYLFRGLEAAFLRKGLADIGLGNSKEAAEYFEEIIRVYKRSVSGNEVESEFLATVYNNAAEAYRGKGDYDKSYDYNKKSLKIKKSVFGENSVDYAIGLNTLAIILYYKESN